MGQIANLKARGGRAAVAAQSTYTSCHDTIGTQILDSSDISRLAKSWFWGGNCPKCQQLGFFIWYNCCHSLILVSTLSQNRSCMLEPSLWVGTVANSPRSVRTELRAHRPGAPTFVGNAFRHSIYLFLQNWIVNCLDCSLCMCHDVSASRGRNEIPLGKHIHWLKHRELPKGIYGSIQLSKRIDHSCRDMVANRFRVIAQVGVYSEMLFHDGDPHEQSIWGCPLPCCIMCSCHKPELESWIAPLPQSCNNEIYSHSLHPLWTLCRCSIDSLLTRVFRCHNIDT